VADSLVRNLETDPIKREIIASLASIGRRIEATLIAEGIEREEERRALVALEIDYGQGFLLGRPSFQVPPRRKNGSLSPLPAGEGRGEGKTRAKLSR
jgi:EAL domain-containing protein (putative c-di-GMP-specific phosphodiesterase class I)